MTLPGARNLLMSDVKRFESPTPTSGPGAVLLTPGGKCCWIMKPAVREVNASWLLLKYAAVPAFETAVAISGKVALPRALPTHQAHRLRDRLLQSRCWAKSPLRARSP